MSCYTRELREKIDYLYKQIQCLEDKNKLCFKFDTKLEYDSQSNILTSTYTDNSRKSVKIDFNAITKAELSTDKTKIIFKNNKGITISEVAVSNLGSGTPSNQKSLAKVELNSLKTHLQFLDQDGKIISSVKLDEINQAGLKTVNIDATKTNLQFLNDKGATIDTVKLDDITFKRLSKVELNSAKTDIYFLDSAGSLITSIKLDDVRNPLLSSVKLDTSKTNLQFLSNKNTLLASTPLKDIRNPSLSTVRVDSTKTKLEFIAEGGKLFATILLRDIQDVIANRAFINFFVSGTESSIPTSNGRVLPNKTTIQTLKDVYFTYTRNNPGKFSGMSIVEGQGVNIVAPTGKPDNEHTGIRIDGKQINLTSSNIFIEHNRRDQTINTYYTLIDTQTAIRNTQGTGTVDSLAPFTLLNVKLSNTDNRNILFIDYPKSSLLSLLPKTTDKKVSLDVNTNARFRGIPDVTNDAAFNGNKIVYVDDTGTLGYKKTSDGTQASTSSTTTITGTSTVTQPANVNDLNKVTTLQGTWGPKDVAVLIVAGQSNAYGHGTSLGTDGFNSPLENVFTLRKADNPLSKTDGVIWHKHQSNVDNNLGDSIGYLASMANLFAKKWQNNKTSKNLPDLYLIQVSTGGKAIAEPKYGIAALKGWSPETRNELFDKAKKNIRLAMQDLLAKNYNPRIIGIHWNQWEGDADQSINTPTSGYACQYYERNLLKILNSFTDWSQAEAAPVWLYNPISTVYDSVPSGVTNKKPRELIKTAIENVQKNRPNTYLMDALKAPGATTTGPNFGIFQSDNVHYKKSVHQYFADEQYNMTITQGNIGAVVHFPYNEHSNFSWSEVVELKKIITNLRSRIISLDIADKEFTIGKITGTTNKLIGYWEEGKAGKISSTGIFDTNFVLYDAIDKKGAASELKSIILQAKGSIKTVYLIGPHTKADSTLANNYIVGNKVEIYYDSLTDSIKAKWKEGRAKLGTDKYAFNYNELNQLNDTLTVGEPTLDWSTITKRNIETLKEFKSLAEFKTANMPEGVYSFNIGGNIFKAKTLSNGWMFIIISYGGWTGIIPKTSNLDTSTTNMLNQTIIAALDIKKIRIYHANDDATKKIDVTTDNATLITRLKGFLPLHYKINLNGINENWVGTNAAYLKADASNDLAGQGDTIDRVVFATDGNADGLHWIPFRGNQKPTWTLGEIPTNTYLGLLVQG